MRFRIALPALALLGAAACTVSSDTDGAHAAVVDHFTDIAPLTIVSDSFHVIDVAREDGTVAFRTVWEFQDTSGAWVDTSMVLTARISEQGGPGLRVTGYDGPLAAHIVELVDEDRRRRYEDLLDAVHHVYHAIVEAGWYYSPDGIDPSALRERVAAGGHDVHHPWGITPVTPGIAQVIWLSDAADSTATCALPITDGAGRAEGFEWVEDRQWFTCRGRTPEIYSRAHIPIEVRDAMQADGVLAPAPAASRPPATHNHD